MAIGRRKGSHRGGASGERMMATVAPEDVEAVLKWMDLIDPDAKRFFYVGSAGDKIVIDAADPDAILLKLMFGSTVLSNYKLTGRPEA